MPNATFSASLSAGGLTIQSPAIIRTASAAIGLEETLPAAKSGTLTTRTDDNTGTLTMSAGHGLTTGQIVDIYWTGGVQYAVTLGTVSTNSVPFDSGIGDNLPIATTAVTVCVHTTSNILIDGDNTDLIGIVLETNDSTIRTAAHIQFLESDNTEVTEIDLVANVPQYWDIAGGASNPFTGELIGKIRSTQAGTSSTETYRLKIIGVQDASP